MFETKSRIIDGISFKVRPFPAIEALQLKAYLLKTFGPAFGRAIGGLESSAGADLKINGAEISGAIQTLFSQLSESDFVALIQRMLKEVACEIPDQSGKMVLVNMSEDFSAKLDIVFQGKLFTIYPVILFVLEVNFPDFFGKVGGIGRRLQTMLSKKDAQNAEVSSTKSETSES